MLNLQWVCSWFAWDLGRRFLLWILSVVVPFGKWTMYSTQWSSWRCFALLMAHAAGQWVARAVPQWDGARSPLLLHRCVEFGRSRDVYLWRGPWGVLGPLLTGPSVPCLKCLTAALSDVQTCLKLPCKAHWMTCTFMQWRLESMVSGATPGFGRLGLDSNRRLVCQNGFVCARQNQSKWSKFFGSKWSVGRWSSPSILCSPYAGTDHWHHQLLDWTGHENQEGASFGAFGPSSVPGSSSSTSTTSSATSSATSSTTSTTSTTTSSYTTSSSSTNTISTTRSTTSSYTSSSSSTNTISTTSSTTSSYTTSSSSTNTTSTTSTTTSSYTTSSSSTNTTSTTSSTTSSYTTSSSSTNTTSTTSSTTSSYTPSSSSANTTSTTSSTTSSYTTSSSSETATSPTSSTTSATATIRMTPIRTFVTSSFTQTATSSTATSATRTSFVSTTVTSATDTTTTRTRGSPQVISPDDLQAMEDQRKKEAAQAVAATETAEISAVLEAISALPSSNTSTQGLLGEISIKTPVGWVKVVGLSLDDALADGLLTISMGEETGGCCGVPWGAEAKEGRLKYLVGFTRITADPFCRFCLFEACLRLFSELPSRHILTTS